MASIAQIVHSITPSPVWKVMRSAYYRMLLRTGRSYVAAETTKARARREREGFFEKYTQGRGLDVGYGGDRIRPDVQGWDIEHGDAQYLQGLADESFDYLYSSHTLEHVRDAEETLRNWWRVIRRGGYLLLYIPHRDLYEKKKTLPSNWNPGHERFFLLDRDEAPDTVGIVPMIERTLSNYEMIDARVCDEGHTITDPTRHSDGEYSIEVVLRKK